MLSALPSTVDENPHCGERHQLAQRNVLCRFVDAELEDVLVLQRPALGGAQTERHLLALGHEPQRGEATGAGVVELQEEAPHSSA